MLRLVPRVGEEDVHARQQTVGDHVVQHLDGIVLDEAQVLDVLFAGQFQQAAHARRVHFDADEILVRHRLRDVRRRVAHAEADLQDQRRGAAERGVEIELGLAVLDQVMRTIRFQRARLAGRQAAGAGDETADAAFGRVVEHGAALLVGRRIGRHGDEMK